MYEACLHLGGVGKEDYFELKSGICLPLISIQNVMKVYFTLFFSLLTGLAVAQNARQTWFRWPVQHPNQASAKTKLSPSHLLPAGYMGGRPHEIKGSYWSQNNWVYDSYTVIDYNAAQQPTLITDYNPPTVLTGKTRYDYNANGNVIRQKSFNARDKAQDSTLYTYSYNTDKRVTAFTTKEFNSSYTTKATNTFFYNSTNGTLDSVFTEDLYDAGTGYDTTFIGTKFIRSANGTITGLRQWLKGGFYGKDGFLTTNLSNAAIAFNIGADEYSFLPEDPLSLTKSAPSFIVSGQSIESIDGKTYDTTRYTGQTSGTNAFSRQQVLQKGIWKDKAYYAGIIDGNGLPIRDYEFDNNASTQLATNDFYEYTFDADNNVSQLIKTDSTQSPPFKTKSVYSEFLVGSKPVLKAPLAKISPNPAQGFVMVSNLKMGSDIQIKNPYGQVIWQGSAEEQTTKIPLEGIAPGLYLVRAEGQVLRFVKE